MSSDTKAGAGDLIVEVGKAPAPRNRKKLILIGAAAAVLVVGGGGTAGMMLMGGGASAADHGSEEAAEAPAEGHGGGAEGGEGKSAYVDIPPMMVNIRSPDGATRFLKVHVMLLPGPKGTADGITAKLPMIQDAYQPFLRELRPEDLAGSAAVFRIKEELLVRATQVTGPGVVKDVLIQDLVQQ